MMLSSERDEYRTIHFEETELRLGLPGPGAVNHHHHHDHGDHQTVVKSSKRGFSETEAVSETSVVAVDLKLNLSTAAKVEQGGVGGDHRLKEKEKVIAAPSSTSDPAKPPAKAQVVGWPPVRSFRKNIVTVQKKTADEQADPKVVNGGTTSSAAFVKVSMDGAPYLRKVDLKLYKSYQDLSNALGKMFSSFTIGECGTQGMKDFMNESKLIDLLNGSDYVASYEDKDGDWMLVGDVPWEMFVESCKRLRVMKGSEAIGLAPKAVEKCKSRS